MGHVQSGRSTGRATTTALVAGAALLIAAVAAAQDTRQPPSAEVDLESYYPPKAKEAGVSGYVVLDCRVREDGTVTACRAAIERPKGFGFGAATVRLAEENFRMRLAEKGSARGARVRIPVTWKPDDAGGAGPTRLEDVRQEG